MRKIGLPGYSVPGQEFLPVNGERSDINVRVSFCFCHIFDLEARHLYLNGESTRMTKKTRLLTLARRYPFLSVDEIAERVGTTPRYVRTSLSEAGLSLLALRRQQALRMAQDVQVPMAMGAGGGTSAGLTMSTEEVTITDVGME